MEKDYCFVIQPFNDTFNKRYKDIYSPAIIDAGLKPYRVDKDPSVDVIIEEIERKIKESSLCLADISLDNPNVWYELGYALALGKNVVMICSNDRNGKFPFDIQHRNIIQYNSDSTSDYEALKSKITQKVSTILTSIDNNKRIADLPIKNADGMQPYELSLLGFIVAERTTLENSVSIFRLKDLMENVGFNNFATSIGIHLLRDKGYVSSSLDGDYNGEPLEVCKLTDAGLKFVMANIEKFETKYAGRDQKYQNPIIGDELPF